MLPFCLSLSLYEKSRERHKIHFTELCLKNVYFDLASESCAQMWMIIISLSAACARPLCVPQNHGHTGIGTNTCTQRQKNKHTCKWTHQQLEMMVLYGDTCWGMVHLRHCPHSGNTDIAGKKKTLFPNIFWKKMQDMLLFVMALQCKGLITPGRWTLTHSQSNQWPTLISYKQNNSGELQRATVTCTSSNLVVTHIQGFFW